MVREYARKRRSFYAAGSSHPEMLACPVDPPEGWMRAWVKATPIAPSRPLVIGEPGIVLASTAPSYDPCDVCGAARYRHSPRRAEPGAQVLCEGCYDDILALRRRKTWVTGRLKTAAQERKVFSTRYNDQVRLMPCASCDRVMTWSSVRFRNLFFHKKCWSPEAFPRLVAWALGKPEDVLMTETEAWAAVQPHMRSLA